MASAFQNRLVGTIILVALAVIFLPDILDGEKQTGADLQVNIPPKPELRDIQAPGRFPSEQVQQAVTREIEVVQEAAIDDQPAETSPPEAAEPLSTPTPEPEVPAIVEAPALGGGWVIQLGSFRHSKNVRELLDKLEKAGYRAFTRPVKTRSGELTKVFVGPDVQRDELEKAIPHLYEVTKLKGQIAAFTVD